jgi:hypothetical protein
VRIRSRNPCTRARRRLLGWKVRLPLATAVHSLLRMASADPPDEAFGGDAIAVGKLVRLANRRGLQTTLGRSRIATFGRLFEGTDEISLGQTSLRRHANGHNRHSSHVPRQGKNLPRRMLQNGWHSERKLLASANADSITKRRQTTKRGCPTSREPTDCTTTVTSPGPRRPCRQTTERRRLSCIHNLWITMWTERHRSFGRLRIGLKGVLVFDS